jgi:leucyl/phenylalanyl-tRNA---protein transferase
MPLFRLSDQVEFPPAWLARSDGLLCIGGDLSCDRLLLGYQNGIFPWFSENEPILWWSPDPRLVLFPSQIKISRSLGKKIRKNKFTITLDHAFEQTIKACAGPRKHPHEGTWLVDEMVEAYIALYHKGHAHSVETWHENRLVGGLYGVSLGCSFFGESMFSLERDASKLALVALARHLETHGFDIIDCQVTTDHLCQMGAVEISRHRFLDILSRSIIRKPDTDVWHKTGFHGLNLATRSNQR